jgi:hypothetical protein
MLQAMGDKGYDQSIVAASLSTTDEMVRCFAAH